MKNARLFYLTCLLLVVLLSGCTGSIIIDGEHGSLEGVVYARVMVTGLEGEEEVSLLLVEEGEVAPAGYSRLAGASVEVFELGGTRYLGRRYTDSMGRYYFSRVRTGSARVEVTHSTLSQREIRHITIQVLGTTRFDIHIDTQPPVPTTGVLRGYVSIRTTSAVTALEGEVYDGRPELVVSADPVAASGYEPLRDALVEVFDRNGVRQQRYSDSSGEFEFEAVLAGNANVRITHRKLRSPLEANRHITAGTVNWLESLRGGIGYYLLIGVENYLHLPTSNFSGRDAILIGDLLVGANELQGYVRLLTNNQATRANIIAAIDDAKEMARDQDYFVIYFSGRASDDTRYDALLPYDTRIDASGFVRSTIITDGDLETRVRGFRGDVTLILDASFSGNFMDGRITVQDAFKPLAFRKSGYNVLVATDKYTLSRYDTNFRHGVFTYFLGRGLTRAGSAYVPADANRDKDVTITELFNYVRSQMAAYYNGAHDEHVPSLWRGSQDSVVFRYN